MSEAPLPVRVRVFRLDPGQNACVLMLSEGIGPEKNRVGGCYGHYSRNAWNPCNPETCPANVHATQQFWRGYVAAEVWDRPRKKWVSVVLEVSESLELDFRDRYARGQQWEISRAKSQGKKKPPYVGRLLRQLAPNEVPPAFALDQVVKAMYHVDTIDLSQPSPQPGRVYLPARDGQSPEQHQETGNGQPVNLEQRQQLKKMLEMYGKPKGGEQ